jgi:hypothetical protein
MQALKIVALVISSLGFIFPNLMCVLYGNQEDNLAVGACLVNCVILALVIVTLSLSL